MTTLARVNGEAYAEKGLTFRGMRQGDRMSIICESPKGAIEVWTYEGYEGMGGVEVHSPKPLYGEDEPDFEDCHVLRGKCWCDGSSLSYREKFLPMIQKGDSEGVLRALANWYHSHFDA